MTTLPPAIPGEPKPPAAKTPADDTRSPGRPLTPVPPAGSTAAQADPQQDVAPNLGGEERMQDA